MPPVFLGEGKGLADEAPEALAQGVVPAFHVRSLPGLLADTAVSLLRETAAEVFQKPLKLRHLR